MLAHELPIRGGEPALQFCDRTKNVRVEILAARYQGATLNGEVREGHVKKGDHNLDGMCYGLMMVPWPPAYGGRSDVRRYGASVSIQAAWQDLQDSMS